MRTSYLALNSLGIKRDIEFWLLKYFFLCIPVVRFSLSTERTSKNFGTW